jgi:hypothetical protein
MILLRPAVFHSGTSAAGVADAPLASDNDNPAALKLVPLPFSFVWRIALDLTWPARPLLVEQPRNLCNRAPGHRASDKEVRHSVLRGENFCNTDRRGARGLHH